LHMRSWISIPNCRSKTDQEEMSPVGHEQKHGPCLGAVVVPEDQRSRTEKRKRSEHEEGDRQTGNPKNALHVRISIRWLANPGFSKSSSARCPNPRFWDSGKHKPLGAQAPSAAPQVLCRQFPPKIHTGESQTPRRARPGRVRDGPGPYPPQKNRPPSRILGKWDAYVRFNIHQLVKNQTFACKSSII